MRNMVAALFIALFACNGITASAQAQKIDWSDWSRCQNKNNRYGYSAAVPACTRVLGWRRLSNRRRALAYQWRGYAHTQMRRNKVAISDYNSSLKYNPALSETLPLRASAYARMRKFKLAAADYRSALKRNRRSFSAHNGLCYVLTLVNQSSEALEHCNQAVRIRPRSATARYNRGDARFDQKKIKNAFADYAAAKRLAPKDEELYNRVGNAYASLKQYKKAIKEYDKAIALKPSYHHPWRNRGNAYFNLKQYSEAIRSYDEAIQVYPSWAPPYFSRANAYYNLKQYERAIEDYNRTISRDPDIINAYRYRAQAYKSLGKIEKAIDSLSAAIKFKSLDDELFYARGLLYLGQKRYDEAIADFDKAIALDQDDSHNHASRSVALFGAKRDAEAVAAVKRAMALAGSKASLRANVLNSVAWELYEIGLSKKGLPYAEKAIELAPEAANILDTRGHIYRVLGRKADAARDFRKALKIRPGIQSSRDGLAKMGLAP